MKSSTARNLAIALVALTGLSVAAIATYRIIRPRESHVEVDRAKYPIAGIDISAHNGLLDFDSIAAAGISFVYMKASEGEGFRDKAFVNNYAGAKLAGIQVGAYHFFRFDCDGRRQALNFMEATKGCQFDLPVAIDVEESGNPPGFVTETVIGRLEAMVAHLHAAGFKVIIYTNKNGDARFVRDVFDHPGDPELWICSFTDPPLAHRDWKLWQHSHRSRVPGIKGNVDLNTFNGDSAQWQSWLKIHSSAQ